MLDATMLVGRGLLAMNPVIIVFLLDQALTNPFLATIPRLRELETELEAEAPSRSNAHENTHLSSTSKS